MVFDDYSSSTKNHEHRRQSKIVSANRPTEITKDILLLQFLNQMLNLIYNTSNISVCESSKYLGVTIDHRLNFKPHILSLETRVSRSVGILSKLRSTFPFTLLFLYHALVQPHLAYGLPLWGSTFKTYHTKLQILQNKALRIITKSDWRTPIIPKFLNLKILKIADLYTFELAKLMHQYYNNSLPPCFSDFLAHFRPLMNDQPGQKPTITYTFPNSPHVAVNNQ